MTEKFSGQFRGEFINAFNHARFAAPSMNPYARDFGQVTQTAAYPRQTQLGLKANF